ncbi:MAG TPA: hypothetical protein DCS69_00720 [Marinobacter adhaerens]|jgi:transposase|uniref:transposase n=1 Tax=Alteromonas TaxID=226 RepID=UPI00002A51A5|nr:MULTISPECIES: transposase [Alteromonas]HAS75180.1 hypothetical protein [Marinobacter adhaerens]MBT0588129.1 transposase [Alteromonas oceanisediminis]CAI3970869.1 transposase [Alteromonas macleodii]VTP58285.1 transposase [Alteromonas macleodii]HAU17793.1 hypothetical protein [Marinobacter adhaerens]
MSQKRSYKQYPPEFKEEAVALVTEQGYTVPEAAKSLGIATNLLYRWKEKQEQSASESKPTETELEELKRLRQEVKTLRMEKEIFRRLFSSLRRRISSCSGVSLPFPRKA